MTESARDKRMAAARAARANTPAGRAAAKRAQAEAEAATGGGRDRSGTPPKGRARTTAGGAAGEVAAKAPAPARPPKAPARPTAALESTQLTKDYGDLVALSPLDLRVERHEAVVLIGHNGSGKTTFLRMAAGLLDPSKGEVTLDGHPVGSLGARAATAYLSDTPTFYEDLSVWEHMEYTARLHGVREWQQDAADLLGHLGIYDRADDLPSRFSRGLKQKAAIALAFIRPFDLLLVDEPFVGLDARGKEALLELFDQAHEDGAALVVATHELAFVERVERCVALRDGQLVHDGPTAGIDVLSLVT